MYGSGDNTTPFRNRYTGNVDNTLEFKSIAAQAVSISLDIPGNPGIPPNVPAPPAPIDQFGVDHSLGHPDHGVGASHGNGINALVSPTISAPSGSPVAAASPTGPPALSGFGVSPE
jgi:hypothetical protein